MIRPRPAAILLDYGGTLDGDAQHWFDHFLTVYARCDVPMTAARLKPAFYGADEALARLPGVGGLGLVSMVEAHVDLQLGALGIVDAAVARRLVDAFVADTRAAWDRNRALLRRLAEVYRLGVVSNSYGNMEALLDEAALAPFAVIVDSEVVGLRKPDPAIYALAADRLGLGPADVLHVGDSWERDVVAACAAGMRAAWLARRDATMPTVPADVWRLTSLLDLAELLA